MKKEVHHCGQAEGQGCPGDRAYGHEPLRQESERGLCCVLGVGKAYPWCRILITEQMSQPWIEVGRGVA